MQINNTNLIKCLNKLKKIINEYENCYYQIYSVYKQLLIDWNDVYSDSFADVINVEKKQVDVLFELLKIIYNIVLDMYKKYIKFGEKVFLNDYYDVDNVYSLSGYVDLKNIYERNYKINNDILNDDTAEVKKKNDDSKNDILNKKNKYRNLYNDIFESENIFCKRLSEIEIIKIDSIDFNSLAKNNNVAGKVGFFGDYERKLLLISSLITSEIKMQHLIIYYLLDLTSCYVSKNNKIIELLTEDIKNNFIIINDNHLNSIKFFESRLDFITDIAEKAKADVKNIGDDYG